jgi:hypothetical protein
LFIIIFDRQIDDDVAVDGPALRALLASLPEERVYAGASGNL